LGVKKKNDLRMNPPPRAKKHVKWTSDTSTVVSSSKGVQ
jgi:hypothetical protein